MIASLEDGDFEVKGVALLSSGGGCSNDRV